MSFSGNVKEELSHQIAQARHCQIAELAALISMCGAVVITPGEKYRIKIHTEKNRRCEKMLYIGDKNI